MKGFLVAAEFFVLALSGRLLSAAPAEVKVAGALPRLWMLLELRHNGFERAVANARGDSLALGLRYQLTP